MNPTSPVAPTAPRELDYESFRSTAVDQFVPLQVTSDRPGAFHGRMLGSVLDDVHVVDIGATAHTVERTPDLIARGGADRYKVTMQLAGRGLLVQDGREAVLEPGDLAIYDTGRPYSLIFDEATRILVFMFPRRLVDLPVDSVGELTSVRFPGDRGVGAIVGPLLRRTADPTQQRSRATASRLTYGALDFVTTLLSDELDQRSDPRDPHAALVRRIRAYIDDHLGDADLDPGQIASAHFISTRHLHGLFQGQGTTVAAWIRSQRLERCRRDLLDPVFADRPVGAVAARWGLHDAAHFSRIFKATFGVAPSEHRQSARR
ncbi:helix-turn-helix domain-containing protein [Schumannella luteola]|uniref:AraC-like DNA-binding protein n=1 Tax=Schumannella luteola TaxID=472059 RepID=A0A852YBP8_9MICO|nr:helix-turn-helix domain-containing protein [Schumannella luteola]NYG99262.1 AraC-like DNA-binding protein [Schumannella luteola]TPX05644.1 helix-turn-helix domain-containing protein [Schumannella luteola]